MCNEIMNSIEVKQAIFHILEDFAQYCEENNLNYMLDGGTLLGAVRHKGFIPWDDDIDTAMPRPDYDKFLSLIKDKPLKSNYRVECVSLNNSPYPFIKIVDTNTIIINSESSLHTSLWIDVFPLDGRPNYTDFERRFTIYKLSKWSFLLENACCDYRTDKKILHACIKNIVIFYSKIKGAEYYGKKLDSFVRRNKIEDCEYIAECVWGGLRDPNGVEKELLLECIELVFEGKKFKAPKGYHRYLKGVYGDYMKLPPENKRTNHDIQAKYIKPPQ